jgi:hypothetical protein
MGMKRESTAGITCGRCARKRGARISPFLELKQKVRELSRTFYSQLVELPRKPSTIKPLYCVYAP